MIVNRIIKDIADELLLSAYDVSIQTGLSVERIMGIVNNYSSATPSEAFIICETLGVDLEGLLGCY